jgi:hypothetical protein
LHGGRHTLMASTTRLLSESQFYVERLLSQLRYFCLWSILLKNSDFRDAR